MKKRIVAGFCLLALLCASAVGCGGRKEEKVPETSAPAAVEDEYEKKDATMELAKDDDLRAFLYAFDPYTDGGDAGSMEYDCRDTIDVRRLMDCLFGQRCCVDYQLYPVPQPTLAGDVMKVPGESFSWVAERIFHVPSNDVADYKSASPAYEDETFSGKITKNINDVQWYYSDFTILRAEEDGSYYYVHYKRNHDDPSVEGEVWQQEYYAVLGKEEIADGTFWTMYTHSSEGFNYVAPEEELMPDVVFETEKEMYIKADTPVTMRMGPSTEYGAISSYSPGVAMMAIGTKGDWVYVHYYDHYGWIRGDLLSEEQQ